MTGTPSYNRFETLAWRYMRLSGVLIIPLVFGHLAIVHLINSVATIDYQWVVETRWAYLGWRLYDAFLLWFAGLHGFNGLRTVINDYVHNRTANRVLNYGAALFLILVLALGSIALIGTPIPEALANLP
ncbi:MAG TPA: succinate dehydrogenase [Chloroflexi bacterium]|nr:succinate dehydrogenase [Chloroflexota bacterium]